jgi:hypothetical protein
VVDLDISQMKTTLLELQTQDFLRKQDPAKYPSEQDVAFRNGVENRRKVRAVLGSVVTPHATEYASLSTPYLIWPSRINGDRPNFNFNSHTQVLNNFANIKVDSEFGDTFFTVDRVVFYFVWQNDTGSDAVLNIETVLAFGGLCVVRAKPGYFWLPFYGMSNIGECRMVVSPPYAPSGGGPTLPPSRCSKRLKLRVRWICRSLVGS